MRVVAAPTREQRWPVLAAVAVAVEGLVLLAVSLVYVVLLVVGTPTSAAAAVVSLVLFALLGLLLLVAARAVSRRRHWARGPVLTWQLLQLAVAWYMTQGDPIWWVGAGVLVVLAVLATVGTVAATRSAHPRSDERTF